MTELTPAEMRQIDAGYFAYVPRPILICSGEDRCTIIWI
jgi:hypothetical protein